MKKCDCCDEDLQKFTFKFGVLESPTSAIEIQRIRDAFAELPGTMHPAKMAEELRRMFPDAEIECSNISVN